MSQAIQGLRILFSVAQEMKKRIYNIKKVFNNPERRPRIAEPQYSKFSKLLVSKFPEIISNEKLVLLGVEYVKNLKPDIIDVYYPYYLVYVDLLEFKNFALQKLNDCISSFPELNSNICPGIFRLFYNSFVLFVQVIMLAQNIEERKLALTTFFFLYEYFNHREEDSRSKILQFQTEYSGDNNITLIKRLWEDLKGVANHALRDIQRNAQNFIKFTTFFGLQNEDAFSIIQFSSRLALPHKSDFYMELIQYSHFRNWFLFSYLLAPEELSVNSGAQELMKYLINNAVYVNLHLEVTVNINKLWEEVLSFKTKNPLSKLKKSMKNEISGVRARCAADHMNIRKFICMQLMHAYHILSDTPVLAAPKLLLILAAFEVTRDELVWYFTHRKLATKNKPNSVQATEDVTVPLLIKVFYDTAEIVGKQRDNIVKYYFEYLKKTDINCLNDEIEIQIDRSSLKNYPRIAEFISFIKNIISNIRMDDKAMAMEVDGKWMDLQASLCGESFLQQQVVYNFIRRMEQVVFHMRVVGCLDELLDDYANLRCLIAWESDVIYHIEKARNKYPSTALTFLRLYSDYSRGEIRNRSEDTEEFMRNWSKIASDMLVRLCKFLTQKIDGYIRLRIGFESRMDQMNSYSYLMNKVSSTIKRSEKNVNLENWRLWESYAPQKSSLDGMRNMKLHVIGMLRDFGAIEEIAIGDSLINPREFLIHEIKEKVNSLFYRLYYTTEKGVSTGVGINPFDIYRSISSSQLTQESLFNCSGLDINNSSLILRQICIYFAELRQLDKYLSLDMICILNNMILSQIHFPVVVGDNKLLKRTDSLSSSTISVQENLSKIICSFFRKMFSNSSDGGFGKIIYLPKLKGFYSIRNGGVPRAEDYLNFKEFGTICSLLGPYGVGQICMQLDALVAKSITFIEKFLEDGKEAFAKFESKLLYKITMERLKAFRQLDFDKFIQNSITIGNTLLFKRLLLRQLKATGEQEIPYIWKSIDLIFSISRKIGSPNPLLDGNASSSFGAFWLYEDSPICELPPNPNKESNLHTLVPIAYALSFLTSNVWKDTTPDVLESNFYVLPQVILELVHYLSNSSDKKMIHRLLRKFAYLSLVILLRMTPPFSPKIDTKYIPKDMTPFFAFLSSPMIDSQL